MTWPAPTPAGFELGSDGPRVVVVGVDGSQPAWRALHYAIGLARRQNSRVLAVCARVVANLAYASYSGGLPAVMTQDTKELEEAVRELGREHGVDVRFVAVDGDPVAALTAVAEESRADMIIVGASEKPGHKVFGSIAVRTVKARRWPVMVVP